MASQITTASISNNFSQWGAQFERAWVNARNAGHGDDGDDILEGIKLGTVNEGTDRAIEFRLINGTIVGLADVNGLWAIDIGTVINGLVMVS